MTLTGWLATLARRVGDWLVGRKPPKKLKPTPEPTPQPDPVRRAFRWPWWLVVLLIVACAMPTDAGLVAVANPEWVAGYHEAEACSGRSGDVTRVRWHVVPDSSEVLQRGRLIGYRQGDDIYLARDWASQRWLARHESLHHLGFRRHDPALFGVRCHATWGFINETLGVSDAG